MNACQIWGDARSQPIAPAPGCACRMCQARRWDCTKPKQRNERDRPR